ncbi:hypothetical protein AURDEDRAFT_149811 [Auricularia subglabra TFB-10046 SS5]|nr:hypothetical protein AURDEDRAFT_149811 [Auricularia subglabra TFB-10046 SS5]
MDPQRATGNHSRKALLIGIRYIGSKGLELLCTHDDVSDIRKILVNHYQYKPEDVTVMLDTDENWGTRLWPSRQNILAQMDLLLSDVGEGDRRVFMYAGHGWPTFDDKLGEIQAIVPVDGVDVASDTYIHESLISAQEMGVRMVAPLPAERCVFTAIVDCCHSNEILGFDPASVPSSQNTDSQPEETVPGETSSTTGTFASSNISETHSLAEELLRTSLSDAPVEIIDIIVESVPDETNSPPTSSGLQLTLGTDNDHTPTKHGDGGNTPALLVGAILSEATQDVTMADDADFIPATDAEIRALSAGNVTEDPFATPSASKAKLEANAAVQSTPSIVICWSSKTTTTFEHEKGLLSESQALGEALGTLTSSLITQALKNPIVYREP